VLRARWILVGLVLMVSVNVHADTLAMKNGVGVEKDITGFRFDVWRAGLSIEEVMMIAEANDIPLHRNGLISGSRHFNPDHCRKYMKTATTYYYPDRLMGRPAKVFLSVTPASKKLFSVVVRFKADKDTLADLRHTLEGKYGQPAVQGKKDLLHKQVKWRVGDTTEISLVSGFNTLKVVYKDLVLERTKEREEEKIQAEEHRVREAEDAKKF
jgi:hypothetical protein